MKTLKLLLFSLFIVTSLNAKPKFLGRLLTTSVIKSTFRTFKVTKGKLDNYDANGIFSSGKIEFVEGGISYTLETDWDGKVHIESLNFSPKTIVENNSLIDLYKSEGSVTEDQTLDSYRRVGLYLVKTSNRIISSDIVSSWSTNSLGRVWDFSTRVTYILTTR